MSAIGPVGHTVIANIERLRRARGLSFQDLAARLGALGRPMLPSVLHRLVQGGRRVDVDDLAAFAQVFGVSVDDLMESGMDDRLNCPACGECGLFALSRNADGSRAHCQGCGHTMKIEMTAI